MSDPDVFDLDPSLYPPHLYPVAALVTQGVEKQTEAGTAKSRRRSGMQDMVVSARMVNFRKDSYTVIVVGPSRAEVRAKVKGLLGENSLFGFLTEEEIRNLKSELRRYNRSSYHPRVISLLPTSVAAPLPRFLEVPWSRKISGGLFANYYSLLAESIQTQLLAILFLPQEFIDTKDVFGEERGRFLEAGLEGHKEAKAYLRLLCGLPQRVETEAEVVVELV